MISFKIKKEIMQVKWNGRLFSVSVPADATVATLKREIEASTTVQPKRQKLLGIKSGAPLAAPAPAPTLPKPKRRPDTAHRSHQAASRRRRTAHCFLTCR